MERLKEIKAKGAETATADDIAIALGVLTDFFNTNSEAQNLIKGKDITGYFSLYDAANYVISIKDGKSEHAQKDMSEPSFSVYAPLTSVSKVLIGDIDVSMGFISGEIEVDGDFPSMVDFFEVIELALTELGLVEKDRELLLDSDTMRKFYNLYMDGAKDIDPADIPLVFDIFTTFGNLNPEAQEILDEEDALIQMNVPDVGSFVIKVADNKLSWSDQKIDNAELEFELSLETAADLLLSGDAATAFLEGRIEAEGNIAQALVMNDLIQVFLEMLPFTEDEEE